MERTHFLLRLFLVLTYTRIAIGQSPDTTRLPVVAFMDVNVIPMTSSEVLQHQTVLVERGLITLIGPANQIKVPENALSINGSNRYLLPGLVDAHVHLETPLGARPHFGDAPLFLASGVTTVINLRGSPEHLKLRDEIRDGLLVAPNLYTSGEFVEEPRVRTPQEAEHEVEAQVKAGYDVIKIHEIVRRATTTGMDLPTYRAVLQSARRLAIPVVGHIPVSIGLQTAIVEHQNLAHVVGYVLGYFVPIQDRLFQRLVLLGVIPTIVLVAWALAALWVRWRTRTRFQPDITAGVFVAFAAAAVALALASLQWLGRTSLIVLLTMMGAAILYRTIGLLLSTAREFRANRPWKRKVVLLAVTTMSVSFCASVAYFVTLAWRSSPANIERTAQMSRNAGIQVMTTCVVDYGSELADFPGMMYVSTLARKQWGIEDGSIRRQSFVQRLVNPHLLGLQLQIVRHLFDAGVPLIAGTDAFGFPGIAPGISLQKELEILREAGLPPYDVLRTATVNPAAFLGKSREFGQVVSGQRADLLLVGSNPLQDLGVLRKLQGVMIRGRWLTAPDLQNMLDGLAK